MAGQYRFKDINGNVVAQISSSAQGAITFSGSAVDFSNASTITLGQVQLAGTASNALLLDGFDSTAFVFTSSFNTISQSISSQLNTLQTTSGSNIGRLNNLEIKSSSVDISISNINSVTASNLARLSNLEIKSSSVDISITNINSVTASNIARLSNLETKSASVDISVSSINTFTASNDITSLNSKTGSYATTGSNSFYGTQVFSGSVYIANDLVVQGSSSIQYISASSVSIGTNIVQLNTANPSVRFAGLTIIDSGSVGGSGSFLYDSLQDEFIFVHRGNGSNITSSHFVLGPETYDSLGNETYLTCNTLSKGTGKEHLVDSCIFDNGTTTCIKNNLVGTGTISGTTIYGSTVICSPVGLFSGCVGIGTTSPAEVLEVSGSLKIGNLKIQNSDGGRIGFNRNTATGAIYNCCYSAFQINGAYLNSNYLDFQNYNSSGSYVGGFVLNNGNVGICTTSPATLLANTSVRPTNVDGLSLNLYGLDWAVNGQGYAGTIWNTSATANNYNAGLLVRICSTDVTDRILDLESGGVNRFRMLGTGAATFNGNVTITNNNWLNFTDSTATARNILTLAGDNNLYLQYRAGCNFYLRDTDGNSRLTITCAGNVGIGITTPGEKFVVQGPANNWTANFIGSSTSGQSLGLLVTAGSTSADHAMIVQNQSSTTSLFRIAGNGVACFGFTVCAPNAQIGCVNSSYGIITSNGVITKSIGGTMAGNTATYFDFPTWDDAGQGQMFEIKAFFDHFYNWNYGAHYYVFLTSRDSNTQALTMFSCGTGNGGSWMAYKTSSTNLRVCKIGGTYGGGGAYWIQVTGKQP